MKYIPVVLLCLLMPGMSLAATYNFWGANYTEVETGKYGDLSLLSYELGFPIMPFDKSMRISGHFTMDTALAASTTVNLHEGNFTSVSFSDGLHSYTRDVSLQLTTDAAGDIIDWDLSLSASGLPYGDYSEAYATTASSSASYMRFLPAGYEDFESEFFSNARGGGGQWFTGDLPEVTSLLASEPALVPVPASLPLLIAGFAGLWTLRRCAAKAA